MQVSCIWPLLVRTAACTMFETEALRLGTPHDVRRYRSLFASLDLQKHVATRATLSGTGLSKSIVLQSH